MALDTKAALATLAGSGKRERINDAQVNLKLPSAVKALVEKIAEDSGRSDAAVWREAMGEYLHKRGYRS